MMVCSPLMNSQHVTEHVVATMAYHQSRILVPVGIHYYGDLMLQRLFEIKTGDVSSIRKVAFFGTFK